MRAQKAGPRRDRHSPGAIFALGLLSLAVTLKPFANAAGNYVCSERHKELNQILHTYTPFPLPVWGGAAGTLYQCSTGYARMKKGERVKTPSLSYFKGPLSDFRGVEVYRPPRPLYTPFLPHLLRPSGRIILPVRRRAVQLEIFRLRLPAGTNGVIVPLLSVAV